MNEFAGFLAEAWSFLDGLAADNTAVFFDANRATYRAAIADPSAAFVTALAPRLAAAVHPGLCGEAKVGRSLFRINRDTRFAADKTPYKTYVDFLFWIADSGDDPRASAACILRLTSATVLTGAGRIGLRGAALDEYRARVVDPDSGLRLRSSVDRLVASGAALSDPVRARPPRPHASGTTNADLLCRDGFHLTRTEPHPRSIAGAGFLDWTIERLQPYRELLELLR